MADYKLPGEHVYRGMTLFYAVTEESINKISTATFVEGDILITSYPKTGTTWMEEVTWTVNKEGDLTEALARPLHDRMLFLEYGDANTDFKAGIDQLENRPRPAIMKTHLPPNCYENAIKNGRVKIIVVVRNPKDTLVSFYNFYQANPALGYFPGSWNDFFELYKAKKLAFGDFFDWYASWVPYLKYPNVQLYAYEDMKVDMKAAIGRLSNFLGKSLTEENVDAIIKHTSFKSMKDNKMTNYSEGFDLKNMKSPFMRKGQVGDWQNYFSEEQSRFVEGEYKEKLEKIGLSLKFTLED